MELWERIEEENIKKEKYIKEHYTSISEEQQRINMRKNWLEVRDEDGNKHYEPLLDNCMFIDASDMNVPKDFKDGGFPVWARVLIVVLVFIAAYIIFLCYLALK